MPRATTPEAPDGELLDLFLQGRRGALARGISMVEDARPGFQELLDAILRETRAEEPAVRIGVTGPPGAGKSTLVSALATRYREDGDTVGIVAVDPTSPFSGGALLGDRIRMRDLGTDPGIFIRSMATRSGTGGLAVATAEVADLMDAFGFQRILVETVGVGQTELEIVGAAETVVVVLVPESGDAVQAMKAGLLEIADVFVVNKADRPGADALVRDLRAALDLRRTRPGGGEDVSEDVSEAVTEGVTEGVTEAVSPWRIPVIPAVATTGEGVDELRDTLADHARWLANSGEGERRALGRARARIRGVVEREVRHRIWRNAGMARMLDAGARAVGRTEETPYGVSRRILDQWSRASTCREREVE